MPIFMDRDSKGMIVMIVAVAVVVIFAVSALYIYSGMSRPLTVVESNSMQHSNDTSYLGIIDTGDMVIMVSPDKRSATTFVEGYQNGHSEFGSYGDVVIYYRDNGKNPVIHRAILWLDYADGIWSAPSLKDYPAELWSNEGTWDNLTGVLTLKDLPYLDTKIELSIDLDSMSGSPDLAHSGYLTKGDKNDYFDQVTSIHPGPVEKEDLKAIAGKEIPWLGCIKLLANHKNINMIPKNSVPCLAVFFIDVIMFIIMVTVISDCLHRDEDRRRPHPSISDGDSHEPGLR